MIPELPKIRFERREIPSRWTSISITVFSIIFALFLSSSLFLSVGADPLLAYKKIFEGAFGSLHGLSATITKSIPLMLCGAGILLAFKARIWNIGAEGQLHMGAFAATLMALAFPHFPSVVLIPSMVLAGFLCGGAWAAIPAILKAKLRVDEIVTTLMMNYIAILWIMHLVWGPWRDPSEYGFPYSRTFPPSAWMPCLFGTRIHLTLFIGIFTIFLIYVLLKKTKLGYEIRVVGESPHAARYAGMSYLKIAVLVMFISGGLAGIAGVGEVSGVQYRLREGISPGYGYMGILVAWLSKLNPLAVVPTSLLLGGLLVGVYMIQIALGLPVALANVFQGLIFFFILGGDILTRYKISIVWK